jgi:hypothetical protein
VSITTITDIRGGPCGFGGLRRSGNPVSKCAVAPTTRTYVYRTSLCSSRHSSRGESKHVEVCVLFEPCRTFCRLVILSRKLVRTVPVRIYFTLALHTDVCGLRRNSTQ